MRNSDFKAGDRIMITSEPSMWASSFGENPKVRLKSSDYPLFTMITAIGDMDSWGHQGMSTNDNFGWDLTTLIKENKIFKQSVDDPRSEMSYVPEYPEYPRFKNWDSKINLYDLSDNVDSPTTLNNGRSIMSRIGTFVKNSFLSKEEKLLRKYDLKTECGDYTTEAKELIITKLTKENEDYLVDIAQKLEDEENKNK